MFQLTQKEWDNLRSQIATAKKDVSKVRYLPYAFTEHGVLMLEKSFKNTIDYCKENNEFMNKSLSADLIVSIHFVIVIFNVGGLLVIILGGILRWRFVRNFWFRAVHLAMILIVVLETIFGITCPLTEWEYKLRITAGQFNASGESFIARLIHLLIFYEFPQIVFNIAYCVFGAAVFAAWFFIPPLYPWKQGKKT